MTYEVVKMVKGVAKVIASFADKKSAEQFAKQMNKKFPNYFYSVQHKS